MQQHCMYVGRPFYNENKAYLTLTEKIRRKFEVDVIQHIFFNFENIQEIGKCKEFFLYQKLLTTLFWYVNVIEIEMLKLQTPPYTVYRCTFTLTLDDRNNYLNYIFLKQWWFRIKRRYNSISRSQYYKDITFAYNMYKRCPRELLDMKKK